MQTISKTLTFLTITIFGCSVQASAGTLIKVIPVPGSTSTYAASINDNNIIVGQYIDANGQHVFDGTLEGDYNTFDIKGAASVNPRSINTLGNIVGNTELGAFEATESGAYSIIGKGKKRKPLYLETANGVNNNGEFIGYYKDKKTGFFRSYFGAGGSYKSDFDLNLQSQSVYAMGINSAGWVVGYAYLDVYKAYRAFLYRNGNVTVIDYPADGAYNTTPLAINDNGLVSGNYQISGKQKGFFYDSAKGTFRTLSVKNANLVSIPGINNAGYAAVYTDVGSFIYCPFSKAKCRS